MILKLKTAKQLQEYGCDIIAKSYHGRPKRKNSVWVIVSGDYHADWEYIPTYDLRDIITDGEMVKQFFGERIWILRGYNPDNSENMTFKILELLQKNKQDEVEAYFLEHTIFNPKNKDE